MEWKDTKMTKQEFEKLSDRYIKAAVEMAKTAGISSARQTAEPAEAKKAEPTSVYAEKSEKSIAAEETATETAADTEVPALSEENEENTDNTEKRENEEHCDEESDDNSEWAEQDKEQAEADSDFFGDYFIPEELAEKKAQEQSEEKSCKAPDFEKSIKNHNENINSCGCERCKSRQGNMREKGGYN